MSGIAIRAEGLSKQYRLGGAQQRYKTLRDSIANAAMRPFRRRNGAAPADHTLFWALKDVSFEIQAGEVAGIIGRNGAGKSTLLKVLSRITEPTTGHADVHGRVGSLLEVGTGFHPELSGRENIYLSGAILGMRKGEVNRSFDDIVDFAEVEQFVDTPVKFYSTGMYLRLAFAVAASLNPEILLVDEVLAVGDKKFQDKCLGRMKALGSTGRTVLLVSHNMGAITSLATKVVVLDQGRIKFMGPVAQGIAAYSAIAAAPPPDGDEAGHGITLMNDLGEGVDASAPLSLRFCAYLPESVTTADVVLHLLDAESRKVVVDKGTLRVGPQSGRVGGPKRAGIRVDLPPLWLATGQYTIQLRVYPLNVNGVKSILSPQYPVAFHQGGSSYAAKGILAPPVTWAIEEPAEVARPAV